MIEVSKHSVWSPNYVAGNILDIDTSVLRKKHITHIVFDLDDTLVERRSNQLLPSYAKFIHSLKAQGFEVLLGSNTKRDISDVAKKFGIKVVQPRGFSYKPLPSFYRRVTAATGTTPQHIAMVGNHWLNDIMGANWAGLVTILVKSLTVQRL